jgi:hypothetical protein
VYNYSRETYWICLQEEAKLLRSFWRILIKTIVTFLLTTALWAGVAFGVQKAELVVLLTPEEARSVMDYTNLQITHKNQLLDALKHKCADLFLPI